MKYKQSYTDVNQTQTPHAPLLNQYPHFRQCIRQHVRLSFLNETNAPGLEIDRLNLLAEDNAGRFFPFTATSNPCPRTLEVMGETSARPTLSLKTPGDNTKAGRFIACSCPADGSKLVNTISPRCSPSSESLIP